MNFQLSAEQRQLQEAARRFAQTELPRLADELEEANEPVPHAMVLRYAELGYLGINLPREYGGHGMSHLDAVVVLEELAKISPAVAFPVFESCFGPILAIAHFAPEALRRRLVAEVVTGKTVVAVTMSEPEAGSALTELATRAVDDGKFIHLTGTSAGVPGRVTPKAIWSTAACPTIPVRRGSVPCTWRKEPPVLRSGSASS